MKKFVSWNVNGLRAILKKNFVELFEEVDADVFAIQETKCQEGQAVLDMPGYYEAYSFAERKGYSGTAVFSKEEPLQVVTGIGEATADTEGRVCACEFADYWFVCVYVPNSQQGLARIGVRELFDARFTDFLCELAEEKPVVVCGDFNVAHEPIDLRHPEATEGNAGYFEIEREDFSDLLAEGFVDTFRHLHPDQAGVYTWWSYQHRARLANAGWRIDYFLVSEDLEDRIVASECLTDVYGSDHCPIALTLDL